MRPHSKRGSANGQDPTSEIQWVDKPLGRKSKNPTYRDLAYAIEGLEITHTNRTQRALFQVLRKAEAMFLSDLIELIALPEHDFIWTIDMELRHLCKTDWDDWGRMPSSLLIKLGWSIEEQKTHFEHLTRLNYVHTERRGYPAVRWVRINDNQINEDISSFQEAHNAR